MKTAVLAHLLAPGKFQLISISGQQVLTRFVEVPAFAGSAAAVETGNATTVVLTGHQPYDDSQFYIRYDCSGDCKLIAWSLCRRYPIGI